MSTLAPGLPVSRENLRIALVENDPDDLFFLERALDTAGFTHPLIHLQDGADAVHYFSTLESRDAAWPDIVLTDLNMPRMNGVEFLAWLRNHPRLKELPVIVLTSSNEPIDLRETTRLGVYRFITKQVRYERVISVLNEFIRALQIEARGLPK